MLVRVEPGSAAKYLRSGVVRTDYPDLHLSDLPDGLLILPALGTVLTVAMAAGVPVEVDEVDADFAAGIDAMAALWQTLHPRFRTADFELRGRRTRMATGDAAGSLLLWSGGLDSTASLIEHRPDVRALFTVWGADVQLSDPALWQTLNRHFDENPLVAGIPRITARSNIRRFPIRHTLVHDFLSPNDSWWGRVQHGLALAGLSAPASVSVGAAGMIRAASFSPDSNQATGSMPELDALTRWAGVQVLHEGFDLTRQQKITERLAPYLADGGDLRLAVCYRRGRHDGAQGVNCGDCEKCLRTGAGLLAAGIDPATVGLAISDAGYGRWTEKLSRGLRLSAHTLPFWSEARAAVTVCTPTPVNPAAAHFLAALAEPSALVAADRRVNRVDYLRGYWAQRREDRLRQMQVSARHVVRTTRRRAGALVAR